MPPSAMRSSVSTAICAARAPARRWRIPSSVGRSGDGGNLGAPPKPPCSSSKMRSRLARPSSTRSAVSGSDEAARAALPRRYSAICVDCSRTRSRSLRQTSESATSTWRKLAMPCRGSGGKYVPREEGRAVGLEEDRHRPAAVPVVEGDDGLHVERVDVRALLAVDLDVDEPRVHQLGGGRVGERLVLHHVAPVARRVADREQDRQVLGARAGEGLVAPRVPVHRVLGVLQQVRGRLAREAVRHGVPP